MSYCAIFRTHCCNTAIVLGRFKGDEMYPPTLENCPMGCKSKLLPSGRKERVKLHFERYADEHRENIPHVHGFVPNEAERRAELELARKIENECKPVSPYFKSEAV